MLTFEGQLASTPSPGEFFLSNIRPRELATDHDFASYRALARADWAPVQMSFPQKCRYLEQIVGCIRETVWTDVDWRLMNCRVPGIRMPVSLGEEKILQVVELEPETQRLRALGYSFLAMKEGFVRHPSEVGDNRLRLDWHLPRRAGAVAAFEDLCRRLRALGLTPADSREPR